MRIGPAIKGFLTFIPGMPGVLLTRGSGGTDSASYCYEVWLKHLTMLWENGMRSIPDTIAELGPGDSLGIGLAAMLSGVDNYYALDVVKYFDTGSNIKIFDELVRLFKTRAQRPRRGWPDFDRYYDRNLFVSHILTDDVLERSLSEDRIKNIRNTILNPNLVTEGVSIKYMIPWSDESVIEKGTVDVVLSHSVLEHVDDLEGTYRALYSWLKPGGMMSHQIDFSSHGFSKKWNGHWACSELLWRIIVGKRPYLINRQPCSTHIDLIRKSGFKIIFHLMRQRSDGVNRSRLSSRWRKISDKDLSCSGTFVQAQKQ